MLSVPDFRMKFLAGSSTFVLADADTDTSDSSGAEWPSN